MPNPMIRIHNTETNKIIDRAMTDKEYEVHLSDLEKTKDADAVKAQAKAALLERLGITAEEAALLLG